MKRFENLAKTLKSISEIWKNVKPEIPGGKSWHMVFADWAILVCALAAGAFLLVALMTPDRRVSAAVNVDGETIHCFVFPENNVSTLLAESGVELREDDELSVSGDTDVYDGMEVSVTRSFPVAVRSQNQIYLLHMTSGTVGDALRKAGVVYDVNDELTECAFEDVAPGMKIVHVDVKASYTTTYKTLHYKDVSRYDDAVYNDTEPVLIQKGLDGTKQVTQRIIVKDGVEVSREVVDQVVITPATDEIYKYGTKIHYMTSYYGDTRIYKKKPTAGVGGWIEMKVDYITAYSSDGRTATGTHTKFGTIAVNPYYIPYYTEIWVPGYGYGKALDTGAFRNYKNADGSPVNQLDLFFVRESDANRWGRKRNVTILVRLG